MTTPGDATLYMLRYSVPLFIRNWRKNSLELIGTGVPLVGGGKHFLLTAKHVVEGLDPSDVAYPTNRDDDPVVRVSNEFIGEWFISTNTEGERDLVDIALLEIPSGVLGHNFVPVPVYMVADSLTLKHIESITLIGYPYTSNKIPPNNRLHKVKSKAIELMHEKDAYEELGLNPISHFCVRFNHKRMTDTLGRKTRPSRLIGLSGGPAWSISQTGRRDGTDEGASLLGIVSEYDEKRRIIWGPRMSIMCQVISATIPELASSFQIVNSHRSSDEYELKHYSRYTKKS